MKLLGWLRRLLPVDDWTIGEVDEEPETGIEDDWLAWSRMSPAASQRIRANVMAYARGEYVWPTLAANAALRVALSAASGRDVGEVSAARLHRALWDQGFTVVPRP